MLIYKMDLSDHAINSVNFSQSEKSQHSTAHFIKSEKNRKFMKLYAFNRFKSIYKGPNLKDLIDLHLETFIEKIISDYDVSSRPFNSEIMKDLNVLIMKETEKAIAKSIDSVDQDKEYILQEKFGGSAQRRDDRENASYEIGPIHEDRYRSMWS